MAVGCERPDRLMDELLGGSLAADDEQPVALSGHKDCWSCHEGMLSSRCVPPQPRLGFDVIALLLASTPADEMRNPEVMVIVSVSAG
jgi:hypothetical protein